LCSSAPTQINLFPIPDSDTGNNMAMAFRALAEATDAALAEGHGCLSISKALSVAMVMNAR
jgi:dihydroxyacetone kinase-like predicted kinase